MKLVWLFICSMALLVGTLALPSIGSDAGSIANVDTDLRLRRVNSFDKYSTRMKRAPLSPKVMDLVGNGIILSSIAGKKLLTNLVNFGKGVDTLLFEEPTIPEQKPPIPVYMHPNMPNIDPIFSPNDRTRLYELYQ